VENPKPVVAAVAPPGASVGVSSYAIRVTGKNFIASSMVTFNGQPRTVAFVDSTRLTVTLKPQDVAMPGDFAIMVTNPPPGGGESAKLIFKVRAPTAK
jgi:hypothetical protein